MIKLVATGINSPCARPNTTRSPIKVARFVAKPEATIVPDHIITPPHIITTRLKFAAIMPEKILPIISGITNAVPTRLAKFAPTIGLNEKNSAC